MNEIGVRELKNQATKIIRQVREQQAEYVITYLGGARADHQYRECDRERGS